MVDMVALKGKAGLLCIFAEVRYIFWTYGIVL